MAAVGLVTQLRSAHARRRRRRHHRHHKHRHHKHHRHGNTPPPTTEPTPVPTTYDRTPVPSTRERHLLTRMGCGFSATALAELRAAGGETAWFEQQLDHESVPETETAAAVASWFPRLQDAPAVIKQNDATQAHRTWQYSRDLANYSLLRRVYSRRTVFESMVELWSNHLHISALHFPGFTQRPAYDATIRQHALGTFEELLVAATLHPAMLMYLDNCKSVKNAPNENHGRELLELHTVGRENYTEPMVKDAARILSGWTVRTSDYSAFYDPNRHTTGAVDLLGFQRPNAVTTDPDLAASFLRHLAHHPATAQRIARKLLIRFVADDPSPALVDRIAQAYLDSGTDIKATLRAIVASDEFWATPLQKVRTPIDDVVATCRVLGVAAKTPGGEEDFANRLCYTIGSVKVFQWPRPDGPPDLASSWASTTRMLNSWKMHWGLSGGWWPKGQVAFRAPSAWLPDDLPPNGITFAQLVDHLSRSLLGQSASDRVLRAACQGCDVQPQELITAAHRLVRWQMPRLLALLLDSPVHMCR